MYDLDTWRNNNSGISQEDMVFQNNNKVPPSESHNCFDLMTFQNILRDNLPFLNDISPANPVNQALIRIAEQ